MAHRDYYDDKSPTGIQKGFRGFKIGWRDFWYKWISFGKGSYGTYGRSVLGNGGEIGYYKFRSLRFVLVALIIGLTIIFI